MIDELRIHGSIGSVEFFTYVSGSDVSKTIFYEETPEHIRFFSRGNEFVITEQEIRYKGCGGSFCEYMFGVDKPLEDTFRKEVVNRLIMFGAYTGKDGRVVFTDNVEGSESIYRLMLQGHAVKNYYFLISSDFEGGYKKRQKAILRAVGKYLKRTPLESDVDDVELTRGFMESLNEENTTVFIIKLIHRSNNMLYNHFRDFYMEDRFIDENREMFLQNLIDKHGIDEYQVERIKIDVMYRHPDNKVVVDEYRDILIDSAGRDHLRPPEIARLKRLRTLAIRNNIPEVLFDTIDSQLLKGRKIVEGHEPEYLKEARGILENLFFKDAKLKKHIISDDIVRLLHARNEAHNASDMGFEQIVLDAGKMCDEMVRETNDFSIFEELSRILTYFDRFDNTSSLLNSIAFTDKFDITEDVVRSLIGNMKEFESLKPGLFRDLFITQLMANKYLTAYGRKRLTILYEGLGSIINGDSSVKDVMTRLRAVTNEERIYRLVLLTLNERIKDIHARLDTKSGRNEIRRELQAEFSKRRTVRKIPQAIFEKAVLDLKKEAYYIHHVFPRVLREKDLRLREDFLDNSGLDRFYVESLERRYFKQKGLPYTSVEEMMGGAAAGAPLSE